MGASKAEEVVEVTAAPCILPQTSKVAVPDPAARWPPTGYGINGGSATRVFAANSTSSGPPSL
jgi:hypothetical protein